MGRETSSEELEKRVVDIFFDVLTMIFLIIVFFKAVVPEIQQATGLDSVFIIMISVVVVVIIVWKLGLKVIIR